VVCSGRGGGDEPGRVLWRLSPGCVGRRAYDPAMVVALLLYCYARGVRSARAIERACRDDVACRVIAMLELPDHATIARFVARHETRWVTCSDRCWACVTRRGWSRRGWSRSTAPGCRGTRVGPRPVDFGQIAERSWPKRKRLMRPRMSSTATRVVMNCLSACARERAGRRSFARLARSSRAMTVRQRQR